MPQQLEINLDMKAFDLLFFWKVGKNNYICSATYRNETQNFDSKGIKYPSPFFGGGYFLDYQQLVL